MLRRGHIREGEGKRRKLRRRIWLMFSLHKNEYRIFKACLNHHKKGSKVEKRKIEEMNLFRLQYIYTWKCHKVTPCVGILNNQKYHFLKNSTKSKNRRA
jgi:hypothetical protein